MRKSPVFLIVVAVLIAAAPPGKKPKKKAGSATSTEFATLSGAWRVQSSVTGERGSDDVCSLLYGRKTKVADEKDPTEMVDLFVQPGRFGFGNDQRVRFYTVTLDPAAKPKTFDLTLAKGKVIRGIYRYDDDSLYLCFGSEDHRPTTDNPVDVHDFLIGYGRKQPQ